MGRKPYPKSIRFHKFKNTTSLLKRTHERVLGNVFERPDWYDGYQRMSFDLTDMNPSGEIAKALGIHTKQKVIKKEQVYKARVHPALALLERMINRRPSFASDVYDLKNGIPNMTQRYFNRMYSLLEEKKSETEAFRLCDQELKTDLIDYERSLTTRSDKNSTTSGTSTAFSVLEEAIEQFEAKREDRKASHGVDQKKNGFDLGIGTFYNPLQYGKADIKQYEEEIERLYDKSKFPWANNWEGRLSRVLDIGMTEMEMRVIQEEMSFAARNPVNRPMDKLEANLFKLGLSVWKKEPRTVRYDTTKPIEEMGELKMQDHRELCHYAFYATKARKDIASQLNNPTGVYQSKVPVDFLRKIWEDIKGKGVWRLIEEELDNSFRDASNVSDDIEIEMQRIESFQKQNPIVQTSEIDMGIQAFNFFKGKLPSGDFGQGSLNEIKEKLKGICGIAILPEEKELRECIARLNLGGLLDGAYDDPNTTINTAKLKKLQIMPAALVPIYDHIKGLIKDLELLNEDGEAPTNGRAFRSWMALQKLTDLVEEVNAEQHGKFFSLEDVMECRDLYRMTLTPGATNDPYARRFAESNWKETEFKERIYLLNERIIPPLTMSQFNRIAESRSFVSKILPMVQNLPEEPEFKGRDLLAEVGYGRLEEEEVQQAIKLQRILPARVRSFLTRNRFKGSRRTMHPNFGKDPEKREMLKEDFKTHRYEFERYSSYGSSDWVQPLINTEIYESNENVKRTIKNFQDYNDKIQKYEDALRKGDDVASMIERDQLMRKMDSKA
ncbi:hypothetical protein AAMO2058_000211500 [Amorphochlora amoebiformis]